MHRFFLAGLWPVLGTVAAFAAGAPQATLITEAEFLSALDADHPAVAESAAALDQARARVLAARTLENPVLGALREDLDGPERETEWSLSWQLPHGARSREIRAREEGVAGAAAEFAGTLQELRHTLREVYAAWAVAAAREAQLTRQGERVAALARRERARAGQGESSGLAARRLEMAAAELAARRALAAAERQRARGEAARWHPALPPEARPLLPPVPSAPEGVPHHPRVAAAEADLAAALLEREAAGRFVLSPELSVGWKRLEAGEGTFGGPTVGLSWAVPLFDRHQGERAATEARVAARRARVEQLRREVETGRDAARTSFETLTTALEAATAARANSARILDSAEAAFRLGEAPLTDLLEIHRAVTEGELVVLDLLAATLAAHREMERLAGPTPTSSTTPQEPTP
jgi:outer membrane protein TolC